MTSDEAVAVSPDDGSSDRQQSDANQAALISAAGGITTQAGANRDQADADQAITVDRLDRLIEVSAALSVSAASVADSTLQEIKNAGRARKRFMVTMIAMVVLTLSLLVPMLLLLVSAAHSRDQLRDCVQPTGKCFHDGSVRTATVVLNLEKLTVLANICSVDPALAGLTPKQRTTAVLVCIKSGLIP